jgi:pilus assembly protein Flp/PilA
MAIKALKTAFNNFISDESGATAIEYGLIAGLIAVAIVAVLTTVGGNLLTTFTAIANALP